MRHHNYKKKIEFIQEPISFNKYTDNSLLKYCLGATMYMPGTKDFHNAILNRKYPGLTSVVLCFEDACREEDLPLAEDNVLNLLNSLDYDVNNNLIDPDEIPLIFIRVRNVDQFISFSKRLQPNQVKYLTGFNFPKFDTSNGEKYFSHLKALNEKHEDILYGMPILESKTMAYIETRMDEMIAVRQILDRYNSLVLNVRIGGTDWSSVFGVRRGINYTIYDILPVADCLKDAINIFARNNDYTVSGPVWEYFRVDKDMKFDEMPTIINSSILKTKTIINDAVDGLLKEVLLDKANGFIGKTVIHPTHIPYVNGMYAITEEVYNDACQILSVDGGVIKSDNQNKMNEIGPHRNWAQKMFSCAKVFGVIKDDSKYMDLFKAGIS